MNEFFGYYGSMLGLTAWIAATEGQDIWIRVLSPIILIVFAIPWRSLKNET